MRPMYKESARILAALLVVLPGHAAAPPARAQELGCVRDQKPMLAVELLFGRNIGGRHGVTEARWQRFVAREITPRFPDGYAMLDGRGHWRDPKGQGVVREHSKMVMLVTADDEATRDHVAAIVAAYKHRFRQKSVMVLSRRVCAAF